MLVYVGLNSQRAYLHRPDLIAPETSQTSSVDTLFVGNPGCPLTGLDSYTTYTEISGLH